MTLLAVKCRDGIAGLHLAVGGNLVRRADPHQRLRPDAALGIRVQPEEVHPHLRQLAEDRLVAVAAPPIGPLGEIVERLNAAAVEQRLARFVQRGQFQGDLLVGHHVAVQVEPHAQVLGKTIGAVERADGVAAGDQQHGPAVVLERLEHVLLRRQAVDRRLQLGVGQQRLHRRPVLRADDDQTAFGCGLQVVDDRQQLAGPQIDVAADLFGRQLLGRRCVLGANHGRGRGRLRSGRQGYEAARKGRLRRSQCGVA